MQAQCGACKHEQALSSSSDEVRFCSPQRLLHFVGTAFFVTLLLCNEDAETWRVSYGSIQGCTSKECCGESEFYVSSFCCTKTGIELLIEQSDDSLGFWVYLSFQDSEWRV